MTSANYAHISLNDWNAMSPVEKAKAKEYVNARCDQMQTLTREARMAERKAHRIATYINEVNY
jgi:hypothetical protein